MNIDWKQVSPALFEKLCAAVLTQTGFVNVEWFGEAGNDKGRDLLAERVDSPVPGIERRERWMVQCKRYIEARLTKAELKDLLDSALEHKIDNLLVVTTTTVSANLRDWLRQAKSNYPFKTYLWEELDFRKEVAKHRSHLLETLPELNAGREPIWMYARNLNEIRLGCNEYEDVEIVVSNVDSVDEAKVKAAEFMRYLHANGFEWWD